MELRQLEYFLACCDQGTFTAAARSLHVVQSAVSTGVAKLERELGVKLFDRTRTVLVLTDAGRAARAHRRGAAPDDAPHSTAAHLAAPRDGQGDDLSRILGIGPRLTEWLHDNGIRRFDQIAAWSPEDVRAWGDRLGRNGGRIDREDWVGQARILAAGGETAHSRRVDQGEST